LIPNLITHTGKRVKMTRSINTTLYTRKTPTITIFRTWKACYNDKKILCKNFKIENKKNHRTHSLKTAWTNYLKLRRLQWFYAVVGTSAWQYFWTENVRFTSQITSMYAEKRQEDVKWNRIRVLVRDHQLVVKSEEIKRFITKRTSNRS